MQLSEMDMKRIHMIDELTKMDSEKVLGLLSAITGAPKDQVRAWGVLGDGGHALEDYVARGCPAEKAERIVAAFEFSWRMAMHGGRGR
jgi:hypothetical protein